MHRLTDTLLSSQPGECKATNMYKRSRRLNDRTLNRRRVMTSLFDVLSAPCCDCRALISRTIGTDGAKGVRDEG